MKQVSGDETTLDLVRPDTNAAAPPVLPPAVDRSGERVLDRLGLLAHAAPVFAPGDRVPLAGLRFALPALQATGCRAGARSVFGSLPNGFYGL